MQLEANYLAWNLQEADNIMGGGNTAQESHQHPQLQSSVLQATDDSADNAPT